jgi:hypothetical protein
MAELPYDFAGVNFQPSATGGVFVGEVTNNSAAPNSAVNVRLHIISPDGTTTATDPIPVALGAQGSPATFEHPVTTSAVFLGYRYEVIP